MFSFNWIPSLIAKKQSQTDIKQQKKHMTALICMGKSILSDKDSLLQVELNWLNSSGNNGFDNYRALLINCRNNFDNTEENLNPEPHRMYKSNHDSRGDTFPLPVLGNNDLFLKQLLNAKIHLACSVNNNLEKQTKAYPPYTFHCEPANSNFSFMIDNEPDDVSLLFRIPDFVEWLGIYKPSLLFSRESNNSEYLFFWLIYNIKRTENDVFKGLFNGLNSFSSLSIGGLFNIFFTDGSGVYTYSNKQEIHNGSKTIFFKIHRDEHNSFGYVLRNSEDLVDFDWIHLKANSLYYFPISGKLRYHLCANPQDHIDVKPQKNRHLSLHPWILTDFII